MERVIFDAILESHEAESIMTHCGYRTEVDAAAAWFDDVSCEGSWSKRPMPKYYRFVKVCLTGDLYYDYGADYYFFIDAGKTACCS